MTNTPCALVYRSVAALAYREVIRFLRQRNRVVGALGQPIVFWLLFGVGLNRTFRLGDSSGMSFLLYYFPGTVVLLLLFTAIFATISVIEDRREGFLQGVLVSPVPRWAVVLGKVLGGATLAVAQAIVLLALAVFVGQAWSMWTWLELLLYLFVLAVGLTAMGLIVAWRMDSTQGFHAVMNLLLMPLWLLSGAFFPVPSVTGSELSQTILHAVMRLNPLTYSVSGLRRLMYQTRLPEGYWEPNNLATCWFITLCFAVLMLAGACAVTRMRSAGDVL